MPGKTLPLENYTNDAQQIVVAAQRLAAEQKHAETTPLHLLARLVEHSHNVLELFRSAGADPNEARNLAELSLRELPKETSEVACLSSHMLGLLGRAEREAQREKAALIGIEHLLHALAQEIRGPTGEVLNALGITPGAFRPHISVLHQGKIEERLADEQAHAVELPRVGRQI
jgi:ATP-dependent Clp protease ATP-binding subunit ClpB